MTELLFFIIGFVMGGLLELSIFCIIKIGLITKEKMTDKKVIDNEQEGKQIIKE